MEIARRARDIKPFWAMDILARARELESQGRSILHLELGDPDFAPAPHIIQAAADAMAQGLTHYTVTEGYEGLRQAVCDHHAREYGISLDPERVLVTMGTSPALFLAFGLLLDEGGEILLPDPHYACYPQTIGFMGGRPVTFPVQGDQGYIYDPHRMRAALTPHTRAILINSPANPTGAVQPPEVLEAIANLGPLVISDEIYHGITYGPPARSILEFTDRAIVLNGFSKRYAMPGFRIGYIIAPRELIPPLKRIHMNFFLSASSFVQKAAEAALRGPQGWVESMVRVYGERRRVLIRGLREAGLGVTGEPGGAFYVLADASHLSGDSLSLCRRILEVAGVAITPGVDFGPRAEGHLRFSYATGLEVIQEAVDRLKEAIGRGLAMAAAP